MEVQIIQIKKNLADKNAELKGWAKVHLTFNMDEWLELDVKILQKGGPKPFISTYLRFPYNLFRKLSDTVVSEYESIFSKVERANDGTETSS